jgi:membrane-associated phospholipid phosphatase
VAVLAVLTVCFARVGLGVHYLSDVSAGVLIGVAWLAVTSAVFEWWRRDVGLPPAPVTEAEPEVAEGVPEPRAG